MTNAPELSHTTVFEQRLGAVALITLNRPERLNAWTDEMGERYRELLAAADTDPDVRAIVVTGAGRGFCSVTDMDALALVGRTRSSEERERARRTRSFALTVGKPLIAAMNGARPASARSEHCSATSASPRPTPSSRHSRGLDCRPRRASRGCCRGWSVTAERWTCCRPHAW
jgi:1,4-dihydroxy-2-naphthoyl-CoA synthase